MVATALVVPMAGRATAARTAPAACRPGSGPLPPAWTAPLADTARGAAEAGFRVFGTLHTNSAAKAIDRIINVFPQEEHDGVRNALGESVKGIVAQQLVRKVGGGRVAALEIMFATPGLSNMIREGRTSQITSMIQMGRAQGMCSMNESLLRLLDEGLIDADAAYVKAVDKSAMRDKLKARDTSLEIDATMDEVMG